MSLPSDDRETVRVESDGSELEAPRPAGRHRRPRGGRAGRARLDGARFRRQGLEHPDTRPRMRGWLHLFAFFGAIAAGAVLVPLASALGYRAGLSVGVYSLTICGLFGISALYHRRRWSPRGWKIMQRLDHSMIFLFIAGTYTPFSLLAVDQPTGYWVLAVVWAGALAGVGAEADLAAAPRWVGVPLYIGLGWVAVFVLPDILHIAGVTSLVLLAVGGAALHARRRRLRDQEAQPLARARSATTSSSTR